MFFFLPFFLNKKHYLDGETKNIIIIIIIITLPSKDRLEFIRLFNLITTTTTKVLY